MAVPRCACRWAPRSVAHPQLAGDVAAEVLSDRPRSWLVASVLRTYSAAWISSPNTTTQPRSRSSGLTAACRAGHALPPDTGVCPQLLLVVSLATIATCSGECMLSRSAPRAVSIIVAVACSGEVMSAAGQAPRAVRLMLTRR